MLIIRGDPRLCRIHILLTSLLASGYVEAFEDGLRQGTASVNVAGAMVDIPVYRRAKHILEQATAIADVEKRKAEALARLG